jgi:hypothetical protein
VGECDEEQICNDMFGSCGETGQIGVLVWGDTANPLSYEMSEYLLIKYPWLIDNCRYDIIRYTNHWRRMIGEKSLVLAIETLGEVEYTLIVMKL